uniref:Tetraspanin n=1 Tax=Bombyx mori TaxID=7091 RepID=A0A8R2QYV6_BOMMO|nr:tetraspanin-33 isoform X2 [Bombyx mori]
MSPVCKRQGTLLQELVHLIEQFFRRKLVSSVKGIGQRSSVLSSGNSARKMAAVTAPNAQKMHFTKTEGEYNMKSIRFLLLMITTMFIIISGLMVVMGISVYSHYHSFSFFYESAKTGRFLTPSVLCIFLGLAMFIVSFFGFFGSLKQSTCMVNLYAFVLALILLIKLTIVILAFTMDTNLIMKYVDIPVWDYVNDPEISDEIDSLQTSLGCCGSNSYMDYVGMEFTEKHSTVVVSKEVDGDLVTLVIPSSCCVSNGDAFCTRMYSTSCKTALVNLLAQNAIVIGVLGVSVMFIQLLGIVFALLLARCIRKMKSERALMAWKIREQMIMARAAEESAKDNTLNIGHNEISVA